MADDPTPGEILHRARVAGGEQRPRPWPPESWADRDPQLRALDEAMAAAVEAAVRERIAAHVEAIAANYPEDVFPTTGISRDAIGGAAMRHAYRNAAREIREGADRG